MENEEAYDVLDTIEFPVQFPLSYKALVATSDQNCADNLEAVLKEFGLQVTKTSIGAEAIALAREDRDKFDFVFCDEHLDGMDGHGLANIMGMNITPRAVYTYSADRRHAFVTLTQYALPKPVKTEHVKQLIKSVRWSRRTRSELKL